MFNERESVRQICKQSYYQTEGYIFTMQQQVPLVRVEWNKNAITEVPYTKFLGLKTENKLSWNPHTDNVIKKLTIVCYMLRSAKPYITLSSLTMIYYSLFHSVLYSGNMPHRVKNTLYYKKWL
jgi:hypothetical protein